MDEKIDEGNVKQNSAGDVFSEMVRNAVRQRREAPVVIVSSAEEQIAVENWLAQPDTQSFLKRAKNTPTRTLGLVTQVKHGEKSVVVSYVDQYGTRMSFLYNPRSPIFAEAQEGFKAGDIILNEFSRGINMKKVKPVQFPPVTEEKVINRFLRIMKSKIG